MADNLAAPINTLTDLAAAIRAVVDYNWTDERDDYESDENDSRSEHIFNHLVALDNWINSTSHTPESYNEPKEDDDINDGGVSDIERENDERTAREDS